MKNINFKALSYLLAGTQFLLLVDTSIINVVLPTISTELGFSAYGQPWITNAYLILFGSTLLLAGRMTDLLGKPRIYSLGLWVLILGSVLAAIASSPAMLIIGRAVQGLGSALCAAASLAMILTLFTGQEKQKALTLLAAMAGAGGAAGTVLGGVLTEIWNWRATFWVGVIGAGLLLLLSRPLLAPVPNKKNTTSMDLPGAILLISGQVLLAFGLITVGTANITSWLSLITAALLLMAFFKWERHSPLLPRELWRNTQLLRANVLATVGQLVLFPAFLIINLYLQDVLFYSPLNAGLALLPLCTMVILTASMMQRLLASFAFTRVLGLGFGMITLGLGMLSFLNVEGSFLQNILIPTLFLGVGLPIVAICTSILVGEHTPPGQEGVSAGLLNTAQQFGSVVGIALLSGIYSFYASRQLYQGATLQASLNSGYSLALACSTLIALLSTIYCLWQRPTPLITSKNSPPK